MQWEQVKDLLSWLAELEDKLDRLRSIVEYQRGCGRNRLVELPSEAKAADRGSSRSRGSSTLLPPEIESLKGQRQENPLPVSLTFPAAFTQEVWGTGTGGSGHGGPFREFG